MTLLLALACAPEFPSETLPDASSAPTRDPRGGGSDDTGSGEATDDAVITEATFPANLDCSGSGTAWVTVKNTGSTTWTDADGYRLGAVDDSDPIHPGEGRIYLDAGESVPPGELHTFTVPLAGTGTAETVASDWRMLRENVAWFGESASREVAVSCAGDTGGGDTGSSGTAGPTEADLLGAIIKNSPPDATSWPATATIHTLDFNTEGVYIDFDKRDGDGSWPDVPFGAPGDSLEYTLWIVIPVDGVWYTSGCIQYWRGLERNGGPPSGFAENWYYDSIRWAPMTGVQPAVGDSIGFFVTAGDARNVTDWSGSTVYERSNMVVVPFPSDAGATFTW